MNRGKYKEITKEWSADATKRAGWGRVCRGGKGSLGESWGSPRVLATKEKPGVGELAQKRQDEELGLRQGDPMAVTTRQYHSMDGTRFNRLSPPPVISHDPPSSLRFFKLCSVGTYIQTCISQYLTIVSATRAMAHRIEPFIHRYIGQIGKTYIPRYITLEPQHTLPPGGTIPHPTCTQAKLTHKTRKYVLPSTHPCQDCGIVHCQNGRERDGNHPWRATMYGTPGQYR